MRPLLTPSAFESRGRRPPPDRWPWLRLWSIQQSALVERFGADVVMGHDPNCMGWIKAYREPSPEGESSSRREGRRRARG